MIAQYQQSMRYLGVDNMSSTGGVTSAAHTAEDIDWSTRAFEQTVRALRDQKLIHALP